MVRVPRGWAAYRSKMELSNGDLLTIKWTNVHTEGTLYDPPEDDPSDVRFFIEGREVERDELPPEVTDAVIERLQYDGETDPNETFGPPE